MALTSRGKAWSPAARSSPCSAGAWPPSRSRGTPPTVAGIVDDIVPGDQTPCSRVRSPARRSPATRRRPIARCSQSRSRTPPTRSRSLVCKAPTSSTRKSSRAASLGSSCSSTATKRIASAGAQHPLDRSRASWRRSASIRSSLSAAARRACAPSSRMQAWRRWTRTAPPRHSSATTAASCRTTSSPRRSRCGARAGSSPRASPCPRPFIVQRRGAVAEQEGSQRHRRVLWPRDRRVAMGQGPMGPLPRGFPDDARERRTDHGRQRRDPGREDHRER